MLRGLIRSLFWWLFAVFAIGQISEIFHLWIIGVLASVAVIGIYLAYLWPKKNRDAGALATTMIMGISVFGFLLLTVFATFFHLGWLLGVCVVIITVVGVGCGLYDFERFLRSKANEDRRS